MKQIMKSPFHKFCVSLNIIPKEYICSLSQYELVIWLIRFLEEKIIPAVNNNGEVVEELQNLYVELKNFVDNYFDNLDVQEEINNKLDEMTESGYFTNLFLNYLNISHVFNTTEEMINSEILVSGQTIKTLGYYNIFDDGGAFFKITNEKNPEIYQIPLKNNLYANIIYTDTLNIKQIGAKSDETIDNTEIFNNAINYFKNIFIPGENFWLKNIVINKSVKISGIYNQTTLKRYEDIEGDFIKISSNFTEFSNITLMGDRASSEKILNGLVLNGEKDSHIIIENVNIYSFTGDGLQNYNAENRIINLYTYRNNGNGILNAGSDGIFQNITASFNYACGIREQGASDRWITCKAFGNGETYNVNTPHNKNGYGFRISDSYGSQFIECDAQENYSHGFYVSSYKNASLISCNSDNNGMINKTTPDEADYVKKFGFMFTNCEKCKLIGFTNNFRYSTLNVRWQYASISFGDTNINNCSFEITSLNQIEEIYIENYNDRTNILNNKNNYFKLNNINYPSKFKGQIKIINDDYDTSRLDFEMKDSENYYRIVRSTDNSLRIAQYNNNNGIIENGNIIQINQNNGLILGSNSLGFFGTTPVTKATLKENASDLDSAIQLINDIKANLIRLGLCN